MKNLWIKNFLSVILIATASVAHSAEGGIDGSGGNAARIFPKTIDAVVSHLPELAPHLVARMEITQRHQYSYQDPISEDSYPFSGQEQRDILAVNQTWFPESGEQALMASLAQISYVSADQCLHDNSDSAASYHDGVICINRQKLSRLSFEAAIQQIVGLSFHELAHHFSFGEREARAIQKYVSLNYNVILPPTSELMSAQIAIEAFEEQLAWVEEEIVNPNRNDMRLCVALGELKSRSEKLRQEGFTLRFRRSEGLKIIRLAYVAVGYCGTGEAHPSSEEDQMVPMQNTRTLSARIREMGTVFDRELPDQFRYFAANLETTERVSNPFSTTLFFLFRGLLTMDQDQFD